MHMPGTNVWGPLFVIVSLIGVVLVIKILSHIWHGYLSAWECSEDSDGIVPPPSWVSPTIATICVVGGLVVCMTLGWNAVMGVTSNLSSYENPAEVEARKKTQQSKAPTKDEMDAAKDDLKARSDEKPHATALSSFDKAMQDEAEKIRQRSLTTKSKEDVK
jgi:hypothetical protein